MKFYRCSICGKIIAMVEETNVDTICCGQEMVELVPNTQDGAREKHVPVIEINGNRVTIKVGEVAHPMSDAHFIKWIVLLTNKGNQRKVLSPSSLPEASFLIGEDEKVLEALAYCNLHGLYSKKQ